MPLTKVSGSVWDSSDNNLVANVKDFGVTGDGVTNDTATFQAALTASSGQILYVPNGTYIVDTLSLPDNTHLLLEKNAIMKLLASSSTKVIFNSGNDDIVIEGGQFDNNELTNSVAIQFSGANCKIFRCHHLGGTTSQIFISLNSAASQVEVAYCTSDASRFFVLTGGTTSTTSDVWVHHCYAVNTTGDFVEINCPSGTARRWTVSDNIVVTCGRDDNGTGFGVGSSGGTSYIDGLIIANNHFRDVDNQAIHIEDGSRNVLITGNMIYGNGANSTGTITEPSAIYVAATAASNRQISNITISNNTIIGTGDMKSGIFFGGTYDITNVIITNNNIEVFDTYGIALSSLITQGNIIGNSCRDGTGSASGIRLIGTNILVGLNRFSDNAGYGIYVDGTPVNIQLVKNQIKNNTTGRIYNIGVGTNMDWSLQYEAVTSSRTITGTVNNLDPLDEGLITVGAASSTPQLTGILAKPNAEVYIYNGTGAASFDIMHEDTNSTAANRFITTDGSDITLATGKLAHFKYVGSRWRQMQ